MTYQAIKLQIDRYLAVLTLNRPDKMNALNKEMQLEIQDALDRIETDLSIRAVIINGAGPCFSAGFDISGSVESRRSLEEWRQIVSRENAGWLKIWRSRLPFIAAVHGYCLGGACDLSMVCDITIAADNAQFGEPEIQFQSASAFPVMPWVLGMKKTKELTLTGDRIGAAEAERIGLVNKVVPADQLMDEARRMAIKLAKIPPSAMQLNKQQLNRTYDVRGFASTMDIGAEFFTMVAMSESDEGREFKRIAKEQGVRSAFKWRDARFESDGESEK